MKQYLELLSRIKNEGIVRVTVREQVHAVYLAIRCVSTWPKDFHF